MCVYTFLSAYMFVYVCVCVSVNRYYIFWIYKMIFSCKNIPWWSDISIYKKKIYSFFFLPPIFFSLSNDNKSLMPFPYTPMRKNEIREFSFLLLLLSTNQKIGWPEICCLQRVTIIKVIVKSQSVLKGEKSAMTYVKVIESYFPCPNQHSYCILNEYHETTTFFSTPSFVTMIWSLPIFSCNTRKIFYFRKHVANNKWMSTTQSVIWILTPKGCYKPVKNAWVD